MCCAEGGPFKAYQEDDYLLLSGVQHYAFCIRQWALIHIEGLWADNLRTVEGGLMHERAHDDALDGTRQGVLAVRAMPVHSAVLGISGTCDVVEFHQHPSGVPLPGREGTWCAYPVEYKRGAPKENHCDRLQLCAQAMCLEEMLSTHIAQGALYYGETRRREQVLFDDALRDQVRSCFQEMHRLYERRYTPSPKRKKGCGACSMKDQCLPVLGNARSVQDYLSQQLGEAP